ncbi:MAG TPA: HypC/HybG/HupF family hydrogenase formation chaperone [Lentzea sp.]
MSGENPECREDICVTCADLAAPGTVVRLLDEDMALVLADDGAVREVSVALVTAAVGDVVLLHAGEAIAVMSR